MRKPKLWKLNRLSEFDLLVGLGKQRSFQIVIGIALLYIFLITLQIPSLSQPEQTPSLLHFQVAQAPIRRRHWLSPSPSSSSSAVQTRPTNFSVLISRLAFDPKTFDPSAKDRSVELHRAAKIAWEEGVKLLVGLESGEGVRISPSDVDAEAENVGNGCDDRCPSSLNVSGLQFLERGKLMLLPCGLTLGSHVTVVAKPTVAEDQKASSQFIMELQGLRTVEGEEPPRILHFNPRLKGDWSSKPVIEQNTCYRMQWGTSQRCDGWPSKADDETVDGLAKCEKWIRDGGDNSASSKARWWLNRLIGRTKKVNVDWPFPFTEDKLFVLTLSAGLEGYHINVDGRHVTSFPYRTGFTLDDATGLTLSGDVDVHSIFSASLPTSHPSFSPQRHLEMSSQWKVPPLLEQPVELFIGILSAGYHFAERMAVRKSWMQHVLIKSSAVVARFFVGLNARKEVNMELKREAEFFGDIVIVPYIDSYDLVVLKTAAICEYGARTLSTRYIMKCDDDTFVRLDAVIKEVKKVSEGKSLYVGNINYFHKPLRHGKWAVTYEEWPEEDYPPYANGPGYLFSSDIALFIVSEFETHQLRLFKMEDVSIGMWVAKFNSSKPVEYGHSLKFCQFGCINGYYTAHYQSPRQMICLWDKLQKERRSHCCNMR